MNQLTNPNKWYDDYVDEDEDIQIEEYDISALPNDFNVLTIFSFIESGAVRIPDFQRNYVWDIGRASKLIESLLLGLPVPQIFLYEVGRNQFLVIDGQQRLMSIYYFIKKRFPKKEKRTELRVIFDEHGKIPDEVLFDDEYFDSFKLKLPETNVANPFKGLNYSTLEDYKTQFDLRTVRNIIIKQNSPKDDDSSMYEIFNRLNTGGINLKPQEIRASMYDSEFYKALYKANASPAWRHILAGQAPDLHMKDIEILLRGFAMMVDSDEYAPSMTKFLNKFSKKCRKQNEEEVQFSARLLESFFAACSKLPPDAFFNKKNKRFNVALYESAFAALCRTPFLERRIPAGSVDLAKLTALEIDPEFLGATQEGTTHAKNVKKRIERATEILGTL